eukprot:g7961.t1
MSHARTEEEETERYKRELEKMEEKWAKDGWTDEEDFEWRNFGFDDIIYDRLYKKHQRNLRRIRRQLSSFRTTTLWDFVSVAVEKQEM